MGLCYLHGDVSGAAEMTISMVTRMLVVKMMNGVDGDDIHGSKKGSCEDDVDGDIFPVSLRYN